MKSTMYKLLAVVMLIIGVIGICSAGDILSSGLKGYWNAESTWVGGILPTSGDNVFIVPNDTVTFNDTSMIVNLTVDINAMFRTSKHKITDLSVLGNLTIRSGGTFKVQTRDTTADSLVAPDLIHRLHIFGNITHNGTSFDMRSGTASTVPSVSTLGTIHVFFEGSANDTVTINGAYSSTNNDFNAVTINKTGTGRIVLGNNMYINGGSSGQPNATSVLTFVRGKVETGNYALIHLTSTGANIVGASDSSYVVGALGRGMSNSGPSGKDFPVGDEFAYRPTKLYSTTGGSGTGHHAIVRVFHENANTGTSTLNGNIDKVSEVRYYKVSYHYVVAGALTMTFGKFNASYGLDDGIRSNNYDLRVAFSPDGRVNWNGLAQLDSHKTSLTTSILPRAISPDSMRPYIILNANSADCFYVALADTNGGLNPLDGTVPGFSASSTSLSFGGVLLGGSKKDSIVVTNNGSGDIIIRSHTETDSLEYETSPGAPITIAPSASQKFYITFAPDSIGVRTTDIFFYHDGPNSPDTIMATGSGVEVTTLNLGVKAKWNIVSLPLTVLNDTMRALYPSAKSNAFKYEGGTYKTSTTLQPGTGFWIKFDTAETFSISGATIVMNTVDVTTGWNLIGTISNPIPVSAVTPVGTTIISDFFEYTQSYVTADTLMPGSGYWVKVNQPGQLVLNSGSMAAKQSSVNQTLSGMNRLIVRDAGGNIQTLYFGEQNGIKKSFELPPLPPEGTFDVRFASQRMAEFVPSNGDARLQIQVSSAAYPLTVSWDVKAGSLGGSLVIGAKEVSLKSAGSVRIENPETQLALKLSVNSIVPKEFALLQNYPNPFNPSTVISFALPQASVVTLKVYNLLGQEVARVLDRVTLEAGVQNAEFNSGNLTSGVYIYKINAENVPAGNSVTAGETFSAVKKMTLLK